MKTIQVPDHSLVTEEIVHKLDHLFLTSHPTKLKNHITLILMKYLENEHDSLPPDFEDRVVDLSVLIEFLIVAERELDTSKI
ncbi:MAG: hypothetical protein ABJG78_14740 [Cyclobacteriaceae bacterium]